MIQLVGEVRNRGFRGHIFLIGKLAGQLPFAKKGDALFAFQCEIHGMFQGQGFAEGGVARE